MNWDGEERRENSGRRSSDNDRGVCPFHRIQCETVHKNSSAIEVLAKEKADREEVKSKAPCWVLVLFITTSITVFGFFWAFAGWMFKENRDELTQVGKTVTVVETNQKILMRAFNLEPITKEEVKP